MILYHIYFFRLKMPKKLSKNSATTFFFMCYHIAKVDINENVHFRISLSSLNLPLALEKIDLEENVYGNVSFQIEIRQET